MSFFSELKRRNIFKVGAAYAIVAWLLVQVADVALPAFEAPGWILQVFIFFMVVGFPVTLIMAWAYEMTPEGIKTASSVQPEGEMARVTGRRLNYVILALIVLAAGYFIVDLYVLNSQETVAEPSASLAVPASPISTTAPLPAAQSAPPVLRFTINIGHATAVGGTGIGAHLALSPDGKQLVYAAYKEGRMQLYLRALDQFETQPIPGTDGAYHPFFSPDGQWVAFYSESNPSKLKKVSIRGGSPQNIADTNFSTGGSWSPSGTIVYGTGDPSSGRSLYEISASGGTPEPVLLADTDKGYVTPEVLPGEEAILFAIRPGQGGIGNAADGSIAVLSRRTGEVRTLIEGGYRPIYAPSGHILFVRAGDLWAVPFDVDRLEKTGPEVPVVQGVQQGAVQGGAAYALSDTGTLAYIGGSAQLLTGFTNRRLVWVDREGNEDPLPAPEQFYTNPRVSPDGKRLAVTVTEPGNSDIFIYDLARGIASRLTFDIAFDERPVWTPNGERVVFSSTRDGGGLFWKPGDGTGQVSRLSENAAAQQWPETFSPDGSELVFRQDVTLNILSLTDEPTSQFLMEPMYSSAISPDGRWIAYESNQLGATEIYVRPFPNVNDGVWQISTDGGNEPLWGPDGNELFYRNGDRMMVVSVQADANFSWRTPQTLFEDASYFSTSDMPFPSYDVSNDGQQFLLIKPVAPDEEGSGEVRLRVVYNWFEELNHLAPTQ